jgi:hypothetical protein
MDDGRLARHSTDEWLHRSDRGGRAGTRRAGSAAHSPGRTVALLMIATIASALSGCSLFVMAGKMILGDPQVTSLFRQQTRVDLAKDEKRVLVICTTPSALTPEAASVRYELLELLTRRMRRAGIELIDSNLVASWMDRNGGFFEHPSELAADFDTDYIVHVDVERFTTREDSSPNLFRGTMSGVVVAYEIAPDPNGGKSTHRVFSGMFNSQYPSHNPVAAVDVSSERAFVRQCVDRLSTQIAQMFYDHPASEAVF